MTRGPDDQATTVVRVADEDDLATLVSLRAAWANEQDGPVDDPAYRDAFTSWYARERDQRVTWLAQLDGVAVGMLNLALFTRMPRPGRPVSRWGYVSNVFVLAASRGRGLGTALVQAATAYADGHELARLVLSPSPLSVPLYERAGFSRDSSLLVRRAGDGRNALRRRAGTSP